MVEIQNLAERIIQHAEFNLLVLADLGVGIPVAIGTSLSEARHQIEQGVIRRITVAVNEVDRIGNLVRFAVAVQIARITERNKHLLELIKVRRYAQAELIEPRLVDQERSLRQNETIAFNNRREAVTVTVRIGGQRSVFRIAVDDIRNDRAILIDQFFRRHKDILIHVLGNDGIVDVAPENVRQITAGQHQVDLLSEVRLRNADEIDLHTGILSKHLKGLHLRGIHHTKRVLRNNDIQRFHLAVVDHNGKRAVELNILRIILDRQSKRRDHEHCAENESQQLFHQIYLLSENLFRETIFQHTSQLPDRPNQSNSPRMRNAIKSQPFRLSFQRTNHNALCKVLLKEWIQAKQRRCRNHDNAVLELFCLTLTLCHRLCITDHICRLSNQQQIS